jgi:hypothetical protein
VYTYSSAAPWKYVDGKVEIYSRRRFFTVTGDHLPGTPTRIEERQPALEDVHEKVFGRPEDKTTNPAARVPASPVSLDDAALLDKIRRSAQGNKFSDLYDRGDWSGYGSQSEADQALCNMLAFWTGRDEARMDSFFRQSALMRDKWEREDYRNRTITHACECTPETYNPSAFRTIALPAIRTEETAQPEQPSKPAPKGKAKEKGEGKPAETEESQATRLIGMVRNAEFFHTPEGLLYVSFPNQGHTETHAIRSKRFRIYLQTLYHGRTGAAIGSKGVQDALGVFEGRALNGPKVKVYCRIAPHGKDIYIDLGGATWEAIKVTSSGWEIVPDPPVKFIRPKGMLELPRPEFDPDAEHNFRECFNVQSDDDFALLKAFVLIAFRPKGPYPVLQIKGPHGSAKSTATAVLRKLIDPNEAALRALPKEERDLAIAASNSRMIALDNLSHLPDWASDALCRVATGGAHAGRELYTDAEEQLLKYQCPVVFNGIGDVATRGDIVDRSVIVELAEIPDEKRSDEEVFWNRFESYHPGILAYFLDVLESTLAHIDTVQMKEKPRMADFAKFVTAAEEAFEWAPGYFLQAYNRNRKEANNITLDSSVVAQKVRAFLEMLDRENYEKIFPNSLKGRWDRHGDGNGSGITWTGDLTQLLDNFNQLASETERRSKQWPIDARAVSSALRRLQPNLKKAGITVVFSREARRRTVDLQFNPAS